MRILRVKELLKQIYTNEDRFYKRKNESQKNLLQELINSITSEQTILSEEDQVKMLDLIFDPQITSPLSGDLLAEMVDGEPAEALKLIKIISKTPDLPTFRADYDPLDYYSSGMRRLIQDDCVKKNRAFLEFLTNTNNPGILLLYPKIPVYHLPVYNEYRFLLNYSANLPHFVISLSMLNNESSFNNDRISINDKPVLFNAKYDLQLLATSILPKLNSTQLVRFLTIKDANWSVAAALFGYSRTWFIEFLIENKTKLDDAGMLTILNSTIPTEGYKALEIGHGYSDFNIYSRAIFLLKQVNCIEANMPEKDINVRYGRYHRTTFQGSILCTGYQEELSILTHMMLSSKQPNILEWAVFENQFDGRLEGFKAELKPSGSRSVLPQHHKLPQLLSIAALTENTESDAQLAFRENVYQTLACYSSEAQQLELNRILDKSNSQQLSRSEFKTLLFLIDQTASAQETQRLILDLIAKSSRSIDSALLHLSQVMPISIHWLLCLLPLFSPRLTCDNLIKVFIAPEEATTNLISIEMANNNGYSLALMSSLDNIIYAKYGVVYLSGDPAEYYVKGMQQKVTFPQEIDLTNLEEKLENVDFKQAVLAITSKAGHTIKSNSQVFCFRGMLSELQALIIQILSRDYPISDDSEQAQNMKYFDELRNTVMPHLINAFLNKFNQMLSFAHDPIYKELIEQLILHFIPNSMEINTVKELLDFLKNIYFPLSQCQDESLKALANSVLRIKTDHGVRLQVLITTFIEKMESLPWNQQLDWLCCLMNESINPRMSERTRLLYLDDLKKYFLNIELLERGMRIIKIFDLEQFSQIAYELKEVILPKKKTSSNTTEEESEEEQSEEEQSEEEQSEEEQSEEEQSEEEQSEEEQSGEVVPSRQEITRLARVQFFDKDDGKQDRESHERPSKP